MLEHKEHCKQMTNALGFASPLHRSRTFPTPASPIIRSLNKWSYGNDCEPFEGAAEEDFDGMVS